MKIGFIGLGVMGFPMAGHLQRAGHRVTVYNRSADKASNWVATYGGQAAPTPRAAAAGAELVCLCVGNDDDVRSVVLGDDGALTQSFEHQLAGGNLDLIGIANVERGDLVIGQPMMEQAAIDHRPS